MKFKELLRVFWRKKEPEAPSNEAEWFGWPDAPPVPPPGSSVSWTEGTPAGPMEWPAPAKEGGVPEWTARPEDGGAVEWTAIRQDGDAAAWPSGAPVASDASGSAEAWPIEWPMGSDAPISPEARASATPENNGVEAWPSGAPEASGASGSAEAWPIEWPKGSDAPASPAAQPSATLENNGAEAWPSEMPKALDASGSPAAWPTEVPVALDASGSPEAWPTEAPEALDAPGSLEAWPTEMPVASGESGSPAAWPGTQEADGGKAGKKKKAKKEKKAQKEKKEKKPKKSKKRKRKGTEGAEGAEGEEKKKFPLLFILVPASVLLGAASMLLVLRPWTNQVPPPKEGSQLVEPVGKEPNGNDGQGEDPNAEPSQTYGTQDDVEPFKPVSNNPTTVHDAVDTAQAMDEFGRFDPKSLELEGESMAEYHYYTTGKTVEVDGIKCREIMVYSPDETTGTNEIAGRYFLSMDGSRIYRDTGNQAIVELSPAFAGSVN